MNRLKLHRTNEMKISIGSDHRGFALKEHLKKELGDIEWLDVGTTDESRVDYPPFAQKVCANMLSGKADLGILICGSGIGMAIAANRFNYIYASVCWNEESAQVARQDDGINVLALPSDFVSDEQAVAITRAWLSTTFKAGRYQERLDMIDKLVER